MRALSPTATTITAPPPASVVMQGEGAAAMRVADEAQYRYAGAGRWLPANAAAHAECAAWNRWATAVNGRAARRRA